MTNCYGKETNKDKEGWKCDRYRSASAAAAPDGAAHICSLFEDKDKDETGVLKRNKYYNKLMIHNVVITCCTLAKATFVFSLLFHAHCT